MENSGTGDDPLARQLNRQPEDSEKNRTQHEDAENAHHGDDDENSIEFDVRPEDDSASNGDLAGSEHHQHGSRDADEASKPQPAKKKQSALDIVHHWSWITIFSILGTLTRLGLQSLNNYSGHLIPPLVWAQFVGCAVMGFLTEDNKLFPKKHEKYDALYIGLTVGYCGSVTSFSAWILQIYEEIGNTEGYRRPRGYNTISVFTQVMITFGASIVAFRLGNHLAIFADHIFNLRTIPKVKRLASIWVIIFVAVGFQVAAIVTASIKDEWRGIVAFGMVFSPLGALTRWYLSRSLNGRIASFPVGTFSANMIGSLLESVFHLLQHRGSLDSVSCALLQGLQDGYCGALTTVSTFVVELCTLGRGHGYRYGITSVVAGSVIYVIVDGIDYWTHGSASGYPAVCQYKT